MSEGRRACRSGCVPYNKDRRMSHERWHFLEKIEVEAAALAALAFGWFVLWPMVRPMHVDETAVFVVTGSWARLAVLALGTWAIAAICAVLTISSRRQGALLATLAGVLAMSLRSVPMRPMLMRYEVDLPSLMAPMMLETLLLTAVVAGAVVVIEAVRLGARRVAPGWVWPETAVTHQKKPGAGRGKARRNAGPTGGAPPSEDAEPGYLARRFGLTPGLAIDKQMVPFVMPLVVTLAGGLIIMSMTLFSNDRMQIVFSLILSFFAAALAAGYLFPSRTSLPCLAAPVLMGIILYAVSARMPYSGVLTWSELGPWAHVLPLDWISAGCGGAVGGYWLSCRLLEAKAFQNPQPATA